MEGSSRGFPSDPNPPPQQDNHFASSSGHSYPHQEPLSTADTVAESLSYPNDGQMGGGTDVEELKQEWRKSASGPYAGGPVAFPSTSPYDPHSTAAPAIRTDVAFGGDPYPGPYAGPNANASRSDLPSRLGGGSTLGPWDSASQRSRGWSDASALPVSATYPMMTPLKSDDFAGGIPGETGLAESQVPGGHLRNKPSHAFSSAGLSYIDEEGGYHRSPHPRPASAMLGRDDVEMKGLVTSAAPLGQRDSYVGGDVGGQGYHGKFGEYTESPYVYPPPPDRTGGGRLYEVPLFPTGLDRLLALFGKRTGEPLQQAIERKKRGIGGQRYPVASWILALIMTSLMIYELVYNNQQTGKVIATSPSFNYMIGPTAPVLINVGARFPPCMKLVPDIPPTFQFACLNDTANPPTTSCSLEDICGHGGFPNGIPNQTWRFFVPIFLHVGIIHVLLNMVGQITIGAQIEREMGTIPYLIVYFAGGIYGFILGGNFGRVGIPSVGASGALFAANACFVVDLLLHWKYEQRPKLKAFLLAVEFVIGIAIGYIPNAVDGLAHLGGFAMGLLGGMILYPSISETKRHRYIVWGLRVVALVLAILAFVLTTRNFYTDDPNAACEWCRYLSCIPTSSNQYCRGTGLVTTTTTSTKRSWDAL